MEEKILYHAVLAFLYKRKGQLICLAQKKQKIGAGCLMGYGGGYDPEKENPIYAVMRECREEGHIDVAGNSVRQIALLVCHNRTESGNIFTCKVRTYVSDFWKTYSKRIDPECLCANPVETDEMGKPEWFPVGNLPISQLMLGDQQWFPYWLPILLNSTRGLIVTMWYGPHQATLDRPIELYEVEDVSQYSP